MAHPDFRLGGKVFATLGYPDHSWGMVKLNPAQQREFILAAPKAFSPVKGAWGIKGATNVRLDQADEESLREAMLAAGRNLSAKPASKKKSRGR
jgi:hypothetical protein